MILAMKITSLLKTMTLPAAWAFYAQGIPATTTWEVVLERFGLPTALVLFFVWQWATDKNRMGKRISDLETFIEDRFIGKIDEDIASRERIAKVFENYAHAADEQTKVIIEQSKVINGLSEVIRHAPCNKQPPTPTT